MNTTEKNHVVRSDSGYKGVWGRGYNIDEAMDNAGLDLNDSFTYYIFKNDSWDIDDDGHVTWPDGALFVKQSIRGGELSPVLINQDQETDNFDKDNQKRIDWELGEQLKQAE